MWGAVADSCWLALILLLSIRVFTLEGRVRDLEKGGDSEEEDFGWLYHDDI